MSEEFKLDDILLDERNLVCTCPKEDCKWHGNCRDCVAVHRFLKVIPNCFPKESVGV